MLLRRIIAVLVLSIITAPVMAGPPVTKVAGEDPILRSIAAIVVDWDIECGYHEAIGITHIMSSKAQDVVQLDYEVLKDQVRLKGVCRVWPKIYVTESGDPSIRLVAGSITSNAIHAQELCVRCDGVTTVLNRLDTSDFRFIGDWVLERIVTVPTTELAEVMSTSRECYASMVGSGVYVPHHLSANDKRLLGAFVSLQRLLISAKEQGCRINSERFYEVELVAAVEQLRADRAAEQLREKQAAREAAAEARKQRRQEREERRAEQRKALKLSLEELKPDEVKDDGIRWYLLTISNPTDEPMRNVVVQIRGKYKKSRKTLTLKDVKAGKAYSKRFEWRDPKKPRAKVVSVGKAI